MPARGPRPGLAGSLVQFQSLGLGLVLGPDRRQGLVLLQDLLLLWGLD